MATNNAINNTLPVTGILTGNGTSAVTASTVTQYGTVIAGASNAVSSVAPSATSGVALISQGASANPTFGTVVVAGGGTGAVTLTGVLTGNGTSAVTANAVTQYGTVIAGASNAVSSVAPSATSGVPYISQGSSANPVFGTAVVAGGGTGLTATTVGGILLGTSTTAFTNLVIGSNNTVLVSNGTTASWAAVPATAGVTSLAGTANQITASASTGAVTLSIPSTFIAPGTIASTTSLTAGSGFTVTTGATTINSGTSAINIGTDAAAKTTTIGTTTTTSTLALKLGTGGYTLASATGNLVSALSTGETNYPLQPSFLSYLGTGDSNVTGAGATYTLGSGNALTEVFDQNGDITTAGVFTAPVTGRYLLIGVLRATDIGASSMTVGTLSIVTSNRTYENRFNPSESDASSGGLTMSLSVIADMDAADTATVQLVISGGAGDQCDISATNTSSYFSGQLLA